MCRLQTSKAPAPEISSPKDSNLIRESVQRTAGIYIIVLHIISSLIVWSKWYFLYAIYRMFVVFVLHVYYHVPLHHHAAPDTSPLEQVVPSSLFESYCITVASLDMKYGYDT